VHRLKKRADGAPAGRPIDALAWPDRSRQNRELESGESETIRRSMCFDRRVESAMQPRRSQQRTLAGLAVLVAAAAVSTVHVHPRSARMPLFPH